MYSKEVKLTDVIKKLQEILEKEGNLNCFGDYDGRACPLSIYLGNGKNYDTYKDDIYGVHFN